MHNQAAKWQRIFQTKADLEILPETCLASFSSYLRNSLPSTCLASSNNCLNSRPSTQPNQTRAKLGTEWE